MRFAPGADAELRGNAADPDGWIDSAMGMALSAATQGRQALVRQRHLLRDLMLDVSLTDRILMRHARAEHLDAWQAPAHVLPTRHELAAS